MTVRWTVRADGDQDAQFASRPSPIRVAILNIRGFSSFGRAPPCQGGGGGFEPRNPLQNKKQTTRVCFFVCFELIGASTRQELCEFCVFSPVCFCVEKHRKASLARFPRNARHRFGKNDYQSFLPCSPRNHGAPHINKKRTALLSI